MNKEAILFHLREAKEELDRAIRDIETNTSYDFDDFVVGMGHLYHHLNTAWNGRDASRERHRDCDQQDFDTWRKFPMNEELHLEGSHRLNAAANAFGVAELRV
jgi:hypothetical protein